MQERILELLKKERRAFTIEEINDYLGLKTVEELELLIEELKKLENELKIYCTKKDKYMLLTDSHLKVGKFIANKKGFGFVDVDGDEDIFIAPSNIHGAIHGDIVIVEIISKQRFNLEGQIIKVVNRELKYLVGEFYYKNSKGYVDLDDEKANLLIQIDQNKTIGAMNGHKVLVKLIKQIKDNVYKGEIVKIIGHKNDPGVDILSIVYKYGINDVFSDVVMQEVENIPLEVSEEEMVFRRDLRNEEIFTIDGDDTKDIDDAISIKRLDNGNYELGVHIADVSYYVKENREIDKEAYERGTSVYLVDRVIPMLPHKLSNGICSLNPNVDRLTVSCVMEIDKEGNIINYDIFESVIRSKKQMTYKCVNAILERGEIPEGYENYVETLETMNELAQILRKNKERRGFIDFELEESKIIVDDKGEVIDVKLRERGIGEKLIEDFMIAANETVANALYHMDLPFVYRVHDKPDEEKINSFINFINILGYKIKGKIKNINPKSMQQILNQLRDKKEFTILSSMLLRSMQKAIYDNNNIGHFGIASRCYTHFTSPIRRYPDTTVHRLLRTYLFEGKIDNETIDYWDRKLQPLTAHASQKERDAIECEREVEDMKKAEYMMKHIGEEFTGMVSSVMSFGMFIQLPNLIEGLVRIDDLEDDEYTFNEERFSLIGKNSKKEYRLGDTINVIVKSASKEAGTIDFIIAPPKEETK